MSGMRNLVKHILRWMLAPVRRQSVRRNGAVDTTGRISLPNEHLLPLVAEALTRVMARPLRPARAVRPILCT